MWEVVLANRFDKKGSFADMAAIQRKRKKTTPEKIDEIIDWRPIQKILDEKLGRKANAVGNPAYLRWTEDSLLPGYRLALIQSFRKSVGALKGMSSSEASPGHATLHCRFQGFADRCQSSLPSASPRVPPFVQGRRVTPS